MHKIIPTVHGICLCMEFGVKVTLRCCFTLLVVHFQPCGLHVHCVCMCVGVPVSGAESAGNEAVIQSSPANFSARKREPAQIGSWKV